MNVIPLAADSLGVRSVATYVECGDTRIVIDPGASLGRSRFNLPPADAEWEALKRANDRISAYATRATAIFVSHYHEDHFRSDPATYAGRVVLVKDPRRMVSGALSGRPLPAENVDRPVFSSMEPSARALPTKASRNAHGPERPGAGVSPAKENGRPCCLRMNSSGRPQSGCCYSSFTPASVTTLRQRTTSALTSLANSAPLTSGTSEPFFSQAA